MLLLTLASTLAPLLVFAQAASGAAENCVSFATSGLCTQCAPGYRLNFPATACLPVIQNCLVVNSYVDSCIYCNYNFTLTDDHRACLPAIQNCQTYLPSNVSSTALSCAACMPYYLLTAMGACRLRYTHCLVADSVGGNCVLCAPAFVLTSDKGTCLPAVAQCVRYQTSSMADQQLFCAGCGAGYDLSPDFLNCFLTIANCQMYKNTTDPAGNSQCAVCRNNYLLSADGRNCFVTSIDNCQTGAVVNGICTACNTGFLSWFNQTACFATVQNCMSYAYSNQTNALVCTACAPMYDLNSSGLCTPPIVNLTPTISNCQVQNGTVCRQCNGNFSLTIDYRACVPSIQYCLQYKPVNISATNPPAVCGYCQNGYLLYNNTCVYLDQNCAKFLNGKCNLCTTGYTLSNNQMNCLKNINLCRVYNPASYSSTKLKCLSCLAGFALTTDGYACLPSIANCTQYSVSNYTFSALTCLNCSSMNFLSNNMCVGLSTINCLVFNQATQRCTQCVANYTLTTDSLKCLPVIPYCGAYGSSNYTKSYLTCLQCSGGFQLTNDNRACLLMIPNCVTYNPADHLARGFTCASCLSGYFVSQNGDYCNYKSIAFCISVDPATGTCTKCQPSFLPTDDHLNCLPSILNCLQYRPSDVSSTFLQCAACDQNSTLIGSICWNGTVQSCASTDANGVCIRCAAGMVLTSDSKRCLYGIQSCQTYAPSTFDQTALECQTCNSGYFLTESGSCAINVTNCVKYHPLYFHCIACSEDLVATTDGSMCLPAIPNCLTYAISGISTGQLQCLQCTPAYTPTEGNYGCELKTIINCDVMNNVTGLCTACATNYRPTDDLQQCLLAIKSCMIYTPSDQFSIVLQCAECFPGFDLRLNTCRMKPMANCLSRNNVTGLCSGCASGFRLTDDNSACLANIAYCEKFAPSSVTTTQFTCITCQDGSIPVNNNQVCAPMIPYCSYYELIYGYCLYCEPNFSLTTDYELCLPKIENCATYEQSSGASTSLTCSTCAANYTLDATGTTCVSSSGQSETLTCTAGWQLTTDGLKCLPTIAGCAIYQQTSVTSSYNICLQCDSNSILTHNGDECLLLNRIGS